MCADFFFSLNFVLRKSVSTGNNELFRNEIGKLQNKSILNLLIDMDFLYLQADWVLGIECLIIPFVVSKVFLDYFLSCFDYP